MTEDPTLVELTAIAAELNDRVGLLAGHVAASQRQVQRMRWLTVLTAALAVVAVVGGLVSIYLWREVQHTSDANHAAAVQGCRNGNEVREANRVLWSFVLDVSEARNKSMTHTERAQLERIRAWITELYQPHDCSDLSKTYPVPDPPPILKG